jgi:hypothetical protein
MGLSSAALSSNSEAEADDGLFELLGGPLENYCQGVCRITTKDAKLVPFTFNRAQAYTHALIEKQLEETKRVRALILKGRKVGISTYVGARFFRRQHALTDTAIYILSHEETSTTTLFNIAKRFYLNLPLGWRPKVGQANDKVMNFPAMRCSYAVGTAGGKGSARSQTIHCFHGSEVAFWPNAASHLAGALQTVADVDGTEIILESTANGIGGAFHEMWLKAERGEGSYIAIFIPWYWDDMLQRVPPIGWIPIEEEREYQELYNLSADQMYWAHLKNIELGGQPGKFHWLFRQEYPANPQEAFQSSGGEGLVRSALITAARKSIIQVSELDPRLLGADCAANVSQGDSSAFMDRCGRVAGSLVNELMKTDKPMQLVAKIQELHQKHEFHRIFIDVGSVGRAVFDRLMELNYGPILCAVEYGGEANDPLRFRNKRAEIYTLGAEWFSTPGGVKVPDDEVFHRHAAAVDRKPSSNPRIVMVDKLTMRKEKGFSPDKWDAFANTFAEKVIAPAVSASRRRISHRRRRSWMGG